jgi:hypothetical protein
VLTTCVLFQVRVSDVRLGGRVLQQDELAELSVEDQHELQEGDSHEFEEGDDVEHRNGLLGSWSPPEGTTPLASLMAATDGLLGLVGGGLDTNPTNGNISQSEAWSGGERDSGVSLGGDMLDEEKETPNSLLTSPVGEKDTG